MADIAAGNRNAGSAGGDAAEVKRARPVRGRWKRFFRSPKNLFAILVLLAFVSATLVPDALLPKDPVKQNLLLRLKPPFWAEGGSTAYSLGTDSLGRDMASRVIRGSRTTFVTISLAAALAIILGTVLGICAGYLGGWADEIISRLIDIQLAFPSMLLMIAVVGFFGRSLPVLVVTLAISSWPSFARIVRGAVLGIRGEEFILAVKALGGTDGRTMLRHVLPNALSTIVVYASFQLSTMLLVESALSFLGLGVPPPAASWGSIIASGRAYLLEGWWVAGLPGLAIIAVVLGFNFLGDGLRDALDPRFNAR